MSGSSTSFLQPHSELYDQAKEEAWQAGIGHERPAFIYSLLQRHDDNVLDAFWRFHIATSEYAGPPGPEWTRMVGELNQRAIGMLVQEIKDTLRSGAIPRGSFYEGDSERIKHIEDTPDEEGLSLSIGMGAHDVIKPKRELAGLRVRSASPSLLYYEVIGHEHIYFGISEHDLRVKGGTAGLITKEASESKLFVNLWDAVSKFAKGLLTAFASPAEMIVDTAAKIIDLLSLYVAQRAKEYGYDNFPYTCLSSTCKQAETCLEGGNSVQKCQVTALREAVETATMVVPLYRQGRDCLGGDYEACGSIAPVILGFMPKGGRALKHTELEGAISKAKKVESGAGAVKMEETPAGALEGRKALTQAEFEDAAIREAIGRPRADMPSLAEALKEPETPKQPASKPTSRPTQSERLTKLRKKQVVEFADRFHINPKQLNAELARLSKDAGDPAKVRIPKEDRYDAEMKTSEMGEIHEYERDKFGTKRWCRFSSTEKCGVPLGADFDAKVNESLNKKKGGKEASVAHDEPISGPASESGDSTSSETSKASQQRRETIAERAEKSRIAKAKAELEAERESARERVEREIKNERSVQLRIQQEISEIDKRPGSGPAKKARKEALQDKARRVDEKIGNAQAKLEELQADPLAKLRAYSYSPESERFVLNRAAGIDEYSQLGGRQRAIVEPSIDHLVSVDEIATFDGFWDLFEDDQKAILSDVRNLHLMEKGLNSSKGSRIQLTNWNEGRAAYGSEGISAMAKLKSKVAGQLREKIASLPKKTGVKGAQPAVPVLQP